MEPLDTIEIILVVVGYLAIALGVMRFTYPRMKSKWMKTDEIDREQVFLSGVIGVFFPVYIPVAILVYLGYYVIRFLAWVITYQNHG